MTEQTLKYLAIDGLFGLLMLGTQELLDAMDQKDEIGIRIKKKQVELLQKMIAEKQELQRSQDAVSHGAIKGPPPGSNFILA